MKLLALDTATEAVSAALWIEGAIRAQYAVAPREQARRILPMIDTLLAEAGLRPLDLDALAFGRGPGSFTGVRIAAGVVQGMAFAADLPVVPVSTLAALAQAALDADTQVEGVLATIDARMNEVYHAAYARGADGLALLQGEEGVCPAERIAVPATGRWLAAGTGWDSYGETLAARLGDRLAGDSGVRYPAAADMLPLAVRDFEAGVRLPPEQAVPVYLRDKVV